MPTNIEAEQALALATQKYRDKRAALHRISDLLWLNKADRGALERSYDLASKAHADARHEHELALRVRDMSLGENHA